MKIEWIKQFEALKVLKSDENKQHIKSLSGIFPKLVKTNKIKNEIDEIETWVEELKRKDLKYETKNAYMIFRNMK